MDSESPFTDPINQRCNCGCTCSSKWDRTVKRKVEQVEEQPFSVRELGDNSDFFTVAHVEIENEILALREIVNSQKQTIHELYVELEEERNASCSAANEAMSMILRLQREKADIQMEARQFKRFAEEKMAHDQQELVAVEEMLDKKEQLIESLNVQLESYSQRLANGGFNQLDIESGKCDEGSFAGKCNLNMSTGLRQESANSGELEESDRYMYSEDTPLGRGSKPSPSEYPSLRCSFNEVQDSLMNDSLILEKHASGDTCNNGNHVQDIEYRLQHLEGLPSSRILAEEIISGDNAHEKIVSPRHSSNHSRATSTDGTTTYFPLIEEADKEFTLEKRTVFGLRTSPHTLDPPTGEDYFCLNNGVDLPVSSTGPVGDTVDRMYTIDSAHGPPTVRETFMDENGYWTESPLSRKRKDSVASCYIANGRNQILKPVNGSFDTKVEERKPTDYVAAPRGSLDNIDMRDAELVQKLYQRLQALETDREQMNQAISLMQRDNAQVMLLTEITQQLRKELTLERKIVKKPFLTNISFMSILKWIICLFFRGRKTRPSKYQFGLEGNNVGLMILLDRPPHFRKWRCITREKYE